MRRILFATDFSGASRKAFQTAVTMAKKNGAVLTIVHAIVPFTPVAADQYVGPETWEQIEAQAQHWARQHMAALTAKAKKAGVRTVGVIVEGAPVDEIRRAARRARAEMLILGTHGRTGFARFFLGSVAAKVIATAPCPVLTVPSHR